MSKNAVYNPIIPYQFNTNGELKRLSIMFDKIFIAEPAIPKLKKYDQLEEPIAEDDTIKSLYNEVKVYEYLNEIEIVSNIPAFH